MNFEDFLKFSASFSYKRGQLQKILDNLMRTDPEGVFPFQSFTAYSIGQNLGLAVHHPYQIVSANFPETFTPARSIEVLQRNVPAEKDGFDSVELLELGAKDFQGIANAMLTEIQDFARDLPEPKFGKFIFDRIIILLIEASTMFDFLFRSFEFKKHLSEEAT